MRPRDEEKQQALFKATVNVVNRIGFAASSVSKIAKEAGVSPATLYTYYDNKEALLISSFIEIKRKISNAALASVDEAQPVRDCFRHIWNNMFHFTVKYPEYIKFSEQFSNSPYNDKVDPMSINSMFIQLGKLVQRGITQKIIKDVDVDVISAFVFYPIIILSNPLLSRNFNMTAEQVDQTFQLAWDAIKL